MVNVAAAVENYVFDALFFSALTDQLANLLGGFTVTGGAFKAFFDGRGSNQSMAVYVVDDLSVDVCIAAENIEAGSLGRARDFTADSLMAQFALSIPPAEKPMAATLSVIPSSSRLARRRRMARCISCIAS